MAEKDSGTSEGDGGDMFKPNQDPPSTARLLKTFAKLAFPNICTNTLSFLSTAMMIVFAGRTDDAMNVAVIGISNTCNATMLLSLMVGLNGAQETLTSQAFGAGNHRLCGQYLNRGSLILLAFLIPVAAAPCFFAESLFSLIG